MLRQCMIIYTVVPTYRCGMCTHKLTTAYQHYCICAQGNTHFSNCSTGIKGSFAHTAKKFLEACHSQITVPSFASMEPKPQQRVLGTVRHLAQQQPEQPAQIKDDLCSTKSSEGL